MPQDEVETLEAALNFISQYELPVSDVIDYDANPDAIGALNLTQAFESATALQKSHSLEIPQCRGLNHSHSLEIPESDMGQMDFDVGLHAAEAFLDDFDAEKDLFGVDEACAAPQVKMEGTLNLSMRPQLTESSATVAKEAMASSTSELNQNRRRLSRKEEIIDLRDTVAELSEQLDQLHATSNFPPVDASSQVESILYQPESLWQKVAARQLVLRQKAEEANAQLRSLVETRVRQTKNLKRMLSRRNDAETLELVGLKRRKQIIPAGPPPSNNPQVFEKLLKGMDELYVGLDEMFKEKGMPQVPCPGRKRQVQRNTGNGAIVVFLDKNTVPFDLQKTEKAVWKLLTGRHRKDSPYTQGTIDWESREDGDTVTNYVSFHCVAGDVAAQLQVREVARKYVTEDRASFICRSVMETTPTGSYSTAEADLKFYETMTVVVKRGEPLASGQETSVIESYLCATRHDNDTEIARKFRGQVYVDIAIEGWERTLANNNQDIENLLFDEAVSVS